MNRTQEALKLALENAQPSFMAPGWTLVRNEDITAIREALAEQPAQQQEPVAYMNPDDLEKMKRFGRGSVAWATPTDFCTQPVYTSPQSKPLPLTDEQIEQCMKQAYSTVRGRNLELAFARAIEAAHGIGEQN